MPTSQKKVIVRCLTGHFLSGYLAPGGFLVSASNPHQPTLDFLDLEGRSLPLALTDIKFICFVRDFNRDDLENPERLTRRAFLARPRTSGLWLRLTFTTGDELEGLAPQDVSLLDSLLTDAGLFLTPPDERANTHQIYVPRAAIATLQLLAIIQAPRRNKPATPKTPPSQPSLFPA